MLQVTLSNVHLKRTLRQLYGHTQSTPKAVFLDPAWDRSVPIWPGMAMSRRGGDLVSLFGPEAADHPMGLCGEFIGGDGVDEVAFRNINATAVWVLGVDSEFEVLAPAFDDEVAWVDPTDGTGVLVHAWASGDGRGRLVPAGASKAGHTISARPVARLIKVESDTKIVVGGLVGTTA